jgi:uncharacterized protein YlxW (UPF0749 family)/small basic protein
MTLLTEVMQRPLDPGYAAAAERRARNGEPSRRTERSALMLTVLALLGMLLATAGLQARGSSPDRTAERQQLAAEITRQDAAANRLQRDNAALAAAIEAERSRQLDQQARGALADLVDRLGLVTGAIAVTGPGVTLTIDDAEAVAVAPGADPRSDTTTEDGRVLDQDLQVVVNGLWEAGAEAVAINGQRLTALSAIRSAGQAILVDYRPLKPPYRILAIGDPERLPARFGKTAGGRDVKYLPTTSAFATSWCLRSSCVCRPVPASTSGRPDLRRRRPPRPPAPPTALPAPARQRAPARTRRRARPPAEPPQPRSSHDPGPRMIPAIGLVAGIILGLVLQPAVPLWAQPYLPIAVVAALDAVFGGLRALLDGIFDDKVFVVSFLSNVIVAAFIVYLGDQLGVGSQLSTGVVVVLGIRIFSNAAAIRRHLFHA